MKRTVSVIALALALPACSSLPSAPQLPYCPKPPAPPAWILEPEPSLIPKLDQLISPSETGSTPSKASSLPVKGS